MIYWELFWSFFQIGLFSIGGGYAAMPLIQNQVVDIHPWLTMTQFGDIMTIAEMTPGPIAINSATFVGTQVARHFNFGGEHNAGIRKQLRDELTALANFRLNAEKLIGECYGDHKAYRIEKL